jgi:hypothetical protein
LEGNPTVQSGCCLSAAAEALRIRSRLTSIAFAISSSVFEDRASSVHDGHP